MTEDISEKWSIVPESNHAPSGSMCLVGLVTRDDDSVGEWLEHHFSLGFQHAYIVAHECSDALQKHLVQCRDRVTVKTVSSQLNVVQEFNDALETLRGRFQWVAFFSTDDYLNPLHRRGLVWVLEFLSWSSGIVVYRRTFHNAFFHKRSDTAGSVRTSFRFRAADQKLNAQFKPMLNLNRFKGSFFENSVLPRLENAETVAPIINTSATPIETSFKTHGKFDHLVLHHYRFRSWEEFASNAVVGKKTDDITHVWNMDDWLESASPHANAILDTSIVDAHQGPKSMLVLKPQPYDHWCHRVKQWTAPLKEDELMSVQVPQTTKEFDALWKFLFLQESADFCPEMYFELNPDLKNLRVNATQHFVQHGQREGRFFKRPEEYEDFDDEFYCTHNPDVPTIALHPLVHYIRHGKEEGRKARVSECRPECPGWPACKYSMDDPIYVIGAEGGDKVFAFIQSKNDKLNLHLAKMDLSTPDRFDASFQKVQDLVKIPNIRLVLNTHQNPYRWTLQSEQERYLATAWNKWHSDVLKLLLLEDNALFVFHDQRDDPQSMCRFLGI